MPHNSPHHLTLHIAGMTCGSCEILLERKLRAVPGVKDVAVNHRKNTASLVLDTESPPSIDHLAAIIHEAGYSLENEDTPTTETVAPAEQKWIEIGCSLLIIFAVYKVLQAFNLISLAPTAETTLSFTGIILIGLVAGTSSCLAVTGGLLLAIAAKYNEIHRAKTVWEKFTPLLHFNIGRLASYFVLGGMVGVLGKSIVLSPAATGYTNIVVALVMLWLALTMLTIIPKGSFPIRLPKKLGHKIARLSESRNPLAPLMLGALTFFLPCGFTQSLQLVALASGSFVGGATTMFLFALGTLPSLLGISFISSKATGRTSHLFIHFAGVLVLLLSIFNLRNGMALANINFTQILEQRGNAEVAIGAPKKTGIQEIAMRVTPSSYVPNELTVQAGSPVRWAIDGSQASGCTSGLVVPDLKINQPLKKGMNVIEFTSTTRGDITFTCSMGMIRGTIRVL
ncbi:MAG TPA: sulfite exporter TauE/SafE family protein [Candidatus Peribacterales bacterium]|nr:sulfite exporter TauE/SafE family protein [Candidatus Peribacterales bacterium]